VEKFYELVIRHRKIIFAVFIGIAVICAMAQKFVSVNYDMNSYLPEDSPSTVALDVMEDEFDGGIPNARVLIYNVTVPEALSYKEKLGEIDGVTDVTWLDDAVTEKQVQILKKTSSIRNSFFNHRNKKAGAIPHLITDTKKTEFHRNSVLIPVTESG
jgi:Predicted exporters of the RND superfamily